jgi:hypothetical protein
MALPQALWLLPIGFAVGTFGTLVGAGGGFLLMPLLLLLYPGEPAQRLAAVSLAVVFLNALSGSLAYARARRIDTRSALLFAACTVPGAVLGALATARVPRAAFDLVFGVLLAGAAVFLFFRPLPLAAGTRRGGQGFVTRLITDRGGVIHEYSFRPLPGMLLSFVLGFVSSFLGIGGGIVHVPVLVTILGFPVHVATATSHLVLAVTALAGTFTNLAVGAMAGGWVRVAVLGAGVVAGAQLGAFLSAKVRGVWILRALALALGFVGVRIFLSGLQGA